MQAALVETPQSDPSVDLVNNTLAGTDFKQETEILDALNRRRILQDLRVGGVPDAEKYLAPEIRVVIKVYRGVDLAAELVAAAAIRAEEDRSLTVAQNWCTETPADVVPAAIVLCCSVIVLAMEISEEANGNHICWEAPLLNYRYVFKIDPSAARPKLAWTKSQEPGVLRQLYKTLLNVKTQRAPSIAPSIRSAVAAPVSARPGRGEAASSPTPVSLTAQTLAAVSGASSPAGPAGAAGKKERDNVSVARSRVSLAARSSKSEVKPPPAPSTLCGKCQSPMTLQALREQVAALGLPASAALPASVAPGEVKAASEIAKAERA